MNHSDPEPLNPNPKTPNQCVNISVEQVTVFLNNYRKRYAKFVPNPLTPRYLYVIAEQPTPTPHLAHPEGGAALRIALVPVPRVSRSRTHFSDGFDLHVLQP